MPSGDLPGALTITGRNRHWIKAGLTIRDQVTVGHDEAGPDAADTDALVGREVGLVVEHGRVGEKKDSVEKKSLRRPGRGPGPTCCCRSSYYFIQRQLEPKVPGY